MSIDGQHQRSVVHGIVTAWVMSAAFIGAGLFILTRTMLFQPVTYGKAAAFSMALASLPLAVGIGWAAKTRHRNQDIDGSPPAIGTPLELTRHYIQNTLEQTVLFAMAAVSLFFAAPELSTRVLPVMAVWFCIARAIFWIGYARAPLSRAIGFAATFHPILVLLATSLYFALAKPAL